MNSEKKDELDECAEEQTSHKFPSSAYHSAIKVSVFFWLCLDKKFFQNVQFFKTLFKSGQKRGPLKRSDICSFQYILVQVTIKIF